MEAGKQGGRGVKKGKKEIREKGTLYTLSTGIRICFIGPSTGSGLTLTQGGLPPTKKKEIYIYTYMYV